MRRKVIFVHRQGLVNAGSKLMRCDQLCKFGQQLLGDKFDFHVLSIKPFHAKGGLSDTITRLKDSIVIFLKRTITLFSDDALEQLSANVHAICIDYVDCDVCRTYSKIANVHIASSVEGMRLLIEEKKRQGSVLDLTEVALLPHHYDPRLRDVQLQNVHHLSPVYLGNPANVFVPEAVRSRISIAGYPQDTQFDVALDKMGSYNFHYCIRPSTQTGISRKSFAKPFTKGFTAAALNSNLLVTRCTDDALHYLGEGYPFLIENNEAVSIIAALNYAQGVFDSPIWHEALDRMEDVRSKTSLTFAINCLDDILNSLD